MTLLHYIDNEVPNFGEWDSVTQNGSSTVQQLAAAAWPERGSYGIRITRVGTDVAYIDRTSGLPTLAAGEELYVGMWIKWQSAPTVDTHLHEIRTAVGVLAAMTISLTLIPATLMLLRPRPGKAQADAGARLRTSTSTLSTCASPAV